jgi:MFS family permease
MRPIGGILIGAFADHAGRKPAMLVTISLMAIGMLLIALTPPYATIGGWAQLIVITGRLIQGLALGGEVGPSTAYLLEASSPARRGLVASWQISSQGCASLFSGVVASSLTHFLGEATMADWGWRIMFFLGASIVPVGLIIRSHLPETAGRTKSQVTTSSFAVVKRLVSEHGTLLFLTFLVIAASTVSNSIGVNMPVYARSTLGLAISVSTAVPIALGAASIVFPLLGGWLSDRFGRRPIMIWPRALIAAVSVPAFYWLSHDTNAFVVYAVTFLMSAISSINAAAVIVAIPESLPRAVRSAGLSIVYAFSVSIFGGSTNYIVNKLIIVTGDKLAPAYYLVVFSVIGTVAALMLPETGGKNLDNHASKRVLQQGS